MTDALILQKPKARRLRKITAVQRHRIEQAVQAMIDALDAIDAPTEDREEDDPAEDNGDAEPSLGSHQETPSPAGWYESPSASHQLHWGEGGREDREWDGDDLEEDYRFHEPA